MTMGPHHHIRWVWLRFCDLISHQFRYFRDLPTFRLHDRLKFKELLLSKYADNLNNKLIESPQDWWDRYLSSASIMARFINSSQGWSTKYV